MQPMSGSMWVSLMATVLMTSIGTWGLPQMIHKYYGIKDEHEVKRGTIISTFFALLVAGGGYFIGSLSRLFYSDLNQLPGSGAGQKDYLVPNMLADAGLPTVLVGLVLVLLIAASVSTLASITITASSTLTMDFIRPKLRPKMDEMKGAVVTKAICFVFILLSYLIANTNTPILDMMSYSWGVISGSFLAPYLLALYWKGLNRGGGWAGMVGGFITALPPVVCKLLFPEAALPGLGKLVDLGPHFACAAMLVSLLLCWAGSLLARRSGWRCGEANPAFYRREKPAEDANIL